MVGSSIVWDLAAVQISSHVHLELLQLPTFEVYHLEAPGRVSIRSVLRVVYVISVQGREHQPISVSLFQSSLLIMERWS